MCSYQSGVASARSSCYQGKWLSHPFDCVSMNDTVDTLEVLYACCGGTDSIQCSDLHRSPVVQEKFNMNNQKQSRVSAQLWTRMLDMLEYDTVVTDYQLSRLV